MGKIIRKFSFIMLANLLVFLTIGHLLDTIFDEKSKYKLIFLILSIVSLIFLSKNFFKTTLKDMEKFSPVEENNNKQNKKNESK